jgi:(p)ppGpp synthase/HD superfamily hydrolase
MQNFILKKKQLCDLTSNCPATLITFEKYTSSIKEPGIKESILDAALFAAKAHFGQKRNYCSQTAFMVHPMSVSYILWDEGKIEQKDLLVAAMLHDTLEDTPVSRHDIYDNFGQNILTLVEELTEKPKPSLHEELMHAFKMSHEAKIIKLADRTHNIRDLIDHPPITWDHKKLDGFITKNTKLLNYLQGTHEQLEEAFQKVINQLQTVLNP